MASFGDAFKAARSAGKTTFKWQGKSYHTKTKDEMEKNKKSVPVPAARPTGDEGKRSSSVSGEGKTYRPATSTDAPASASTAPAAEATPPTSTARPRQGMHNRKKDGRSWRDVGMKIMRGEALDLL